MAFNFPDLAMQASCQFTVNEMGVPTLVAAAEVASVTQGTGFQWHVTLLEDTPAGFGVAAVASSDGVPVLASMVATVGSPPIITLATTTGSLTISLHVDFIKLI